MNYGKLGIGEYQADEVISEPRKIMDGVLYADAGEYHSIVLKTDGSVWLSGRNHLNQLGDGTDIDKNTFIKVMDDAVFVCAGGSTSAAIKRDGSLWTWGAGGYDPDEKEPIGDLRMPQLYPVKSMADVIFVSVSDNCVLTVKTDESLWGWRTLLAIFC